LQRIRNAREPQREEQESGSKREAKPPLKKPIPLSKNGEGDIGGEVDKQPLGVSE
jgi:hypothetical protein